MKTKLKEKDLYDFLDLKLNSKDLLRINGDNSISSLFDIKYTPKAICTGEQLIFMIETYLSGHISLENVQEWVDNVWWNDNLFTWEKMNEEKEEYFKEILSYIDDSDSEYFGFNHKELEIMKEKFKKIE